MRQFMNFFPKTKIFLSYNQLIDRYPLMVTCLTSGVITGAGDCLCQSLFSDRFDAARFFKFSGLGTVLVGPSLFYWYGFLSRRLPGTTARAVLIRVAADQFLFSPIFLATFISIISLLDGKANQIPEKLKQDFASTLISNFFVWIPAQIVNFKFMPPKFNVLFSNGVAVFWNCYLSYVSFKKVNNEDKKSNNNVV
mmetsp:Transcript_28394/g.28695  ORF Transcript_28394/g.28695 Transcript_28394/m.28695 type:complete len:195 (-) Transcript_28394:136-720(-)